MNINLIFIYLDVLRDGSRLYESSSEGNVFMIRAEMEAMLREGDIIRHYALGPKYLA